MIYEPGLFLLGIILIPILLLFLVKGPEISFALFISAYVLKGGMTFDYFNLTTILLFITLLGYILHSAIKKELLFSLQTSDLILLLFIIILLIGCFYTANQCTGFIKVLRFISIVFLPYMITRIFIKKEVQFCIFLKTIFIIAIIINILLISILFFSDYEGGRLVFLNVNPIPLASLLSLGLVISAIKIINIDGIELLKIKNKLFYLMLAISFLFSLFLVGCRGPMISSIFGIVFYYSFYFRKKSKAFIITGIIVIFGIIFFSNNGVTNNTLCNIPNIDSFTLEKIMGGLSTKIRLNLYSSAIMLFTQNPLLGIGTGGFPEGYPHNLFLEIAAENGILGLVVFIWFLFSVFKTGIKNTIFNLSTLRDYQRNIGLIILTLIFSIFIEKQFSYGLDMHKDLFVFIGLLINLSSISSQEKQRITVREENGL